MAALAYPAAVAIGEAIMWTAAAIGTLVTGAVVADQVSKANERAKTKARLRDEVAAKPCKDCGPKNPCAALAGGIPGSKYKGGAHAIMKGPVGDGLDSHHMPAASASSLPRDLGPAIQMDPKDHWRTASHGSNPMSPIYIASQKKLINSGNFVAASAMDVADIRSKFGSKYDSAIAQAEAYTLCLKKFGLVK